ncbi:phage holin family protein [Subsaxibacter sp. CAU 1640]|uniref:phage holin family protein n=1 Tax=Subsaxibacter sp. CAU 1640 TaxID=2933271 RepID=UPI0020061ED3|nr:phage holin family protein [Subsaxibacter sp. CAU 1640]MCK7591804.1 phage holin family protein [Subsaxibacter sp. CAU 1640]
MPNIFESINNTSDKAVDIGEKYIDDTREYYKLKIFQQLTVSISLVAKALLIGGILFIGLIFLAVAAAIAIGNWMDNMALGYVVVAAILLITGGIVYLKRAFINRKIIKVLSLKFFNS